VDEAIVYKVQVSKLAAAGAEVPVPPSEHTKLPELLDALDDFVLTMAQDLHELPEPITDPNARV
ncbi:unnamed protein product, partial [Ilex paraguariensis]